MRIPLGGQTWPPRQTPDSRKKKGFHVPFPRMSRNTGAGMGPGGETGQLRAPRESDCHHGENRARLWDSVASSKKNWALAPAAWPPLGTRRIYLLVLFLLKGPDCQSGRGKPKLSRQTNISRASGTKINISYKLETRRRNRGGELPGSHPLGL